MGVKDEVVIANNPAEETAERTEEHVTEAMEEVAGGVAEESNASRSETQDTSHTPHSETEAEGAGPPEGEAEGAEVEAEPEEEEEEDLIDPQDTLKETCAERAECQRYKEVLEECNERVASKSNTTETCTQEIFDFLHCVDHCVGKTLFNHLK